MNLVSYKNLNYIFYTSLIIGAIFFLIPPEFKMAVYTPNVLGYFWLLGILPIVLISFLWLTYLDFKTDKTLRNVITRTLALASTIVACVLIGAGLY
jgi:hypothetical protein